MAKPSGKLCTSSTPKTRTERRTPAPPSAPTWTSRPCSSRREASRKSTPEPSPARTEAVEPSSRAGSSRPRTEATDISPTVIPHSAGRRAPARSPRRETGMAPSPVANAVPVPAKARTARSTGLLEEFVIERVADQLGTGGAPDLLLDVGAMRLHGANAEVELAGDLAVGVSERDQPEDLDLAVGQVVRGPGRLRWYGGDQRSEPRVHVGLARGSER